MQGEAPLLPWGAQLAQPGVERGEQEEARMAREKLRVPRVPVLAPTWARPLPVVLTLRKLL